MPDLVVPAWAWGLLAGVMVLLISIDLFAHRGDRIDSRRRALVWTLVWIAAAVGFGAFVAAYFGAEVAEQYFAAYAMTAVFSKRWTEVSVKRSEAGSVSNHMA